MTRPGLAVPALSGQCSVCGHDVPATPAEAPYEGKARLIVHDHPNAALGTCVGSRMVVTPAGQLVLFTVAEIRREVA